MYMSLSYWYNWLKKEEEKLLGSRLYRIAVRGRVGGLYSAARRRQERSSYQNIQSIQHSYLRQAVTLQAGSTTGRSSKSYNTAALSVGKGLHTMTVEKLILASDDIC